MQRSKRPFFRNRLDLTDRVHVRVLRRRLRLSEPELTQLVSRVGNSIATLSKEVAARGATQAGPIVTSSGTVPAATVIVATKSDPVPELTALAAKP